MENRRNSPLLQTVYFGICFTFVSSLKGHEDISQVILQPRGTNEVVFAPNAHPFSESFTECAEEFWIRLIPCDCGTFQAENTNPFNPFNSVFMLGRPFGDVNMDVTIPRDKPIMAPIITSSTTTRGLNLTADPHPDRPPRKYWKPAMPRS